MWVIHLIVYLQKLTFEQYYSYRSDNIPPQSTLPILFNKEVNSYDPLQDTYYCTIHKYEDGNDWIVGTISFRHLSTHTKLRDFEIHQKHRGNGYGKYVLEVVIDQAKMKGSIFISLFVFRHREIARSMYAKYGFLPIKEMDNGTLMIYYLSRP